MKITIRNEDDRLWLSVQPRTFTKCENEPVDEPEVQIGPKDSKRFDVDLLRELVIEEKNPRE